MISPHIPYLVKEVTDGYEPRKVISYGQSSFGYDIRLAPAPFYIFRAKQTTNQKIVDPKSFDPKECLAEATLYSDPRGKFFVIPPNSYALGVSEEFFSIPKDVLGVCVGKSTYARTGLIVNVTPLEPGWVGYLTLEFSNSSPAPIKVYADEGICQILFFRGEQPTVKYDRKYQNQAKEVTYARV